VAKVPTPVNNVQLYNYLQNYNAEERDFLVNGFKNGFKIPISGEIKDKVSKNHPSAVLNWDYVNNQILEELKEGRIKGPFSQKPQGLICSPLALIPKKEPGSFRLIHDLSFPRNDSVNSHINKEHSEVVYDSIDTVVEKVKLCGRSCLMAKTDIANAYRIVPIHPDDRRLLGFSWPAADGKNYYYQDACLTMGLSMSCQLFTRFSNALQRVMEDFFC
jgi:hypothetical protein